MTDITLITPGGGRPESFALCEKYMQRQTLWATKKIQWIVADDDKDNPVKCTLGQEHIFGALQYRQGINTLRYNLAAALPLVKGEVVFIIENDDAYSSRQYLEIMCHHLKYAALVGEAKVTYYSLPNHSYLEMNNSTHASTCQTAFRKAAIPFFEKAVHSGEQYLDTILWIMAKEGRIASTLFSMQGRPLVTGIKGTPGRNGIGTGHRPDNSYTKDVQDKNGNWTKLRELIGLDADSYKDWIK